MVDVWHRESIISGSCPGGCEQYAGESRKMAIPADHGSADAFCYQHYDVCRQHPDSPVYRWWLLAQFLSDYFRDGECWSAPCILRSESLGTKIIEEK